MRLTQIELRKIKPNAENPRGIDIPKEDTKLSYLKDSIKKFGIMVPLVVSQRDDEYLLIDGERRYWASKALGLPKVPAFVLDEEGKFKSQDILYRMFQIHHNREQWLPVQQCHALEGVYRTIAAKPEIKSITNEKARIDAVTEELVEATGIEERTARNRVYFLRQPESLRNRLYENPKEEGYWYICEIEEKIVIPALTNYPEYFETVPVDDVRVDLFEKLDAHSAEKSTEVRRVAPFFRTTLTKESDRKKIKTVLAQLHKKREMTYAEAQDDLTRNFPLLLKRDPVSPRKLHSFIRALQSAIDDFDMSAFSTAQKRAKAPKRELVTALDGLLSSVETFKSQLSRGE